jgi:hypothetical protein
MNKRYYSPVPYHNLLRSASSLVYVALILGIFICAKQISKVIRTHNAIASANTGSTNQALGSQVFYPTVCGSVTHLSACATSMVLNAEAGLPNYTWSTGATTSSITVYSSGTYWWETIDLTNNKVVNGDFTNGNTGFTSSYNYIAPNGSTGGNGALSAEAYYSISTDPKITHTNFVSFGDHTNNTSGQRRMMIVNGAPTSGITIWTESISVQPNTDYIFSVWFTSVYPDNPGQLNFSINGSPLGAPILLTSGTPDWKNFTVRWNSGTSTAATIGMVNQNTAASGNDFALDDIVFAPVCRNTFQVNLYTNPPKPAITPL